MVMYLSGMFDFLCQACFLHVVCNCTPLVPLDVLYIRVDNTTK